MMPSIKVAIQGARGSFHELAANKFFKDNLQCVECMSFKEVFRMVTDDAVHYGIAAIENTVAGTILPVYAMLRDSEVLIVGEEYLHIRQNLLALHGQTINDIREVHSHPMAILQCQNFFEKHSHIRLVEADDTAARARWISENKLLGMGAIAGPHVAAMYRLQTIEESIETHKKNFTRFLVIRKKSATAFEEKFSFANNGNGNSLPDKASVYFNVPHRTGSLAKVLTQLAAFNINLSKIQSMPLVGKEWEYYIHADMEFDAYENYTNALECIKPSLNEFKILGEYKRGERECAREGMGEWGNGM